MFSWAGIAFIVFVVLGVINIVGLHKDSVKINRCTKPFLMPLLALAYWLAMRGSDSFAPYLIIALAFGFLGDTFLLGTSDKLFTCGLLAFLVGHIFYILLFISRMDITAISPLWLILPVVLYILPLIWTAKKLYPSLEAKDKPGVSVYMVAILAMSYTALQFAVSGHGWLPFVGSLLFVASDTMLAFQNFKFRPTPFSRVAVMVTYLLAQSLITFGFIE